MAASAHCKQDKERIETLEWWVAWLLARDAAMVGYQYGEAISRKHARRLGVRRSFEDLLARDRRHRCERDVAAATIEQPTTTPEDTLREAGISSRRQARYQRRMSSLLAGRS